jgi:hypothetical protein
VIVIHDTVGIDHCNTTNGHKLLRQHGLCSASILLGSSELSGGGCVSNVVACDDTAVALATATIALALTSVIELYTFVFVCESLLSRCCLRRH